MSDETESLLDTHVRLSFQAALLGVSNRTPDNQRLLTIDELTEAINEQLPEGVTAEQWLSVPEPVYEIAAWYGVTERWVPLYRTGVTFDTPEAAQAAIDDLVTESGPEGGMVMDEEERRFFRVMKVTKEVVR